MAAFPPDLYFGSALTGDPANYHVYPCDADGQTEHSIEGPPCWCNPRKEAACPACEGPADPDPDCWRCRGEGWAEASEIDDGPFLVIHQG